MTFSRQLKLGALHLLRCAMGVLFIYAGVIKGLHPSLFAKSIANYHLTPHRVTVALSWYLPWLEVFCGICLIIRRMYSGVLTILLLLMFIFNGALAIAWLRGITISCGCFGLDNPSSSYPWLVIRDVLITLGIVVLIINNARSRRI